VKGAVQPTTKNLTASQRNKSAYHVAKNTTKRETVLSTRHSIKNCRKILIMVIKEAAGYL